MADQIKNKTYICLLLHTSDTATMIHLVIACGHKRKSIISHQVFASIQNITRNEIGQSDMIKKQDLKQGKYIDRSQ